MKKLKKVSGLLAAVFLLGAVLSGCGSSSSSSTSADSSKAAPATVAAQPTSTKAPEVKAKKIYVGTQNDYPPFCYNDDSNKLTGYDVEFIKEVDKRLPDYEFEFVTAPWDSIFLSLDSNRTQIVADEIAKNAEREQKYLFSDEAYFKAESVIIVKEDRNDIKTISDLEGKTVAACAGDSYTQILENYNKDHGNKIKLRYTDSSAASGIYQDIAAGRVDAYVNDPIMSLATIKQQGLKLKFAGDPIQSDSIHLTYRKDAQGEELKAKIDAVIKDLKKDGTLDQLSKKWTGGEYVPK